MKSLTSASITPIFVLTLLAALFVLSGCSSTQIDRAVDADAIPRAAQELSGLSVSDLLYARPGALSLRGVEFDGAGGVRFEPRSDGSRMVTTFGVDGQIGFVGFTLEGALDGPCLFFDEGRVWEFSYFVEGEVCGTCVSFDPETGIIYSVSEYKDGELLGPALVF